MKRYLLFSGSDYYPVGGWGDFRGDFELATDAIMAVDAIKSDDREWWHVIDGQTGVAVAGTESDLYALVLAREGRDEGGSP